MIKEDAVEGLVNTIVDVVKETFSIFSVRHGSFCKDIDSQCVRSGTEISSWLSDNLNIRGEQLVDQRSDVVGNGREGNAIRVSSRPATTQIQKIHVVANFFSFFKDPVSALDRRGEGFCAHATRANMEGDTNNVQAKLFGFRK